MRKHQRKRQEAVRKPRKHNTEGITMIVTGISVSRNATAKCTSAKWFNEMHWSGILQKFYISIILHNDNIFIYSVLNIKTCEVIVNYLAETTSEAVQVFEGFSQTTYAADNTPNATGVWRKWKKLHTYCFIS